MIHIGGDELVVLVVFGSFSIPFTLAIIGKILRERRLDLMQREKIKAEHQLEEMRIKTEMENRILGPSSIVTENLTAEIQSLREEVRQVKEQLGQIDSSAGSNIIR